MLLITWQLAQENGNLICGITPDGEREAELEALGLAVFGQKGEINFYAEWDHHEMDQWLRATLPMPFSYLDTFYGKRAQSHWRILKTWHNRLRKDHPNANGQVFKGLRGRTWFDFKIYIGKF
jgi:hypothetical protein